MHESSVLDHRFGSSAPYTLGVEEEYMLLDPETWDLVQHIDSMLARVTDDGEFEARINPELMQSVLEITTPVCHTAAEVQAELRALRGYVAELARREGCRFASAGTHAFSLFERQRITAKDRYRQLVDQLQYIARQELIFGMHVHAAVESPEQSIAVMNAVSAHIPQLLALSASSPFWRGEPTGLMSSRQMIFSAFPRSGVPPRFGNYDEFAAVIGQLERTGCIADYTHIWWDIRPHPRLGTLELEAPIMDLATGRRNRVPLAQLVRRTLRDVEPHARELGSERELEGVREILSRGNGAERQLRIWNANHDIVEVVRELAKETEVAVTV